MLSPAKNAEDAKKEIDKARGEGRGLCELGAIMFLKLVLINNSLVSI